MSEAGLTLDAGTVLAPMVEGAAKGVASQGSALVLDAERVLALLSIAAGQAVAARALDGIAAAARHWAGGDGTLANLRLAFAGLPHRDAPLAVVKLQAADWLLANGVSPRALMRELGFDTAALDAPSAAELRKYTADQPRVPAGSAAESGR